MTSADERQRLVSELLKLEQHRDAIALVEEVTEAARTWQLNWDHGWALYKLGEHARALAPLRRAVLQEPQRATTHWALGVVLLETGDLEAAERHLSRALAMKDSSIARLTLAVLYMQQGRFEDAEEVHREGLRLKPDHRERLLAYADFLSDRGRDEEARGLRARAEALE